jgi:hypothetical protein
MEHQKLWIRWRRINVLPMDRDSVDEQTDTMSSDDELMCVDLAATQSA